MSVKKKLIIAVSWLLAVACMTVIFMLSAQNAEASAELSEETQSFLSSLLFRFIDHNVVRKIAHFIEYCGLSFLTANACFQTNKKFVPYLPFGISFLYCVSDEIHQFFVPGRACRLFDIGVDTGGILLGILIFCAAAAVCGKIRKRISDRKVNKKHLS